MFLTAVAVAVASISVMAAVYKKTKNKKTKNQKIQEVDLVNLNFVGLITLQDPIRSDVKEAIKVCRQAGMLPIIVTGDHRLTAKAVAQELGLSTREENIIEGWELEQLSDEDFRKRLKKINIYARVKPQQKFKNCSGLAGTGRSGGNDWQRRQ